MAFERQLGLNRATAARGAIAMLRCFVGVLYSYLLARFISWSALFSTVRFGVVGAGGFIIGD